MQRSYLCSAWSDLVGCSRLPFQASRKQRYLTLQTRYGQLKTELSEERAAFKEAVKQGDEEAAMVAAKAYLTKVADTIINALERVKAKVEENDDLTQEEVNETCIRRLADSAKQHIEATISAEHDYYWSQVLIRKLSLAKFIREAWGLIKDILKIVKWWIL